MTTIRIAWDVATKAIAVQGKAKDGETVNVEVSIARRGAPFILPDGWNLSVQCAGLLASSFARSQGCYVDQVDWRNGPVKCCYTVNGRLEAESDTAAIETPKKPRRVKKAT